MAWISNKINRPFSFMCCVGVVLCFAACATTSTSTYMEEGTQYASAGEWDKSVQVFQKALEQNPGDPEIKLMLNKSKWGASLAHMGNGEALLKDGLYDKAIAEFQLSIAFFPGNAKAGSLIQKAKALRESDYHLKQGRELLKAQKYHQAREAFDKALKLNPDNKQALEALARFKKEEAQAPRFRLKPKSEAPVSLKFKRTPLLNVFEVLSKLTGINFIFDKDLVETKVTLFMTDVSFDRFLDTLLTTNNLAGKLVDDKTIIIYPDTPAKAKEYEDLQIRTFYLANMDVKKAVGLLAKILKSKDITANETLNAVVIRGPKAVIEIASKIIEANDRAPAEVVLNVELLEVTRSKERELGLDFNPMSVTVGVGTSSPVPSTDSAIVDLTSVYALGNLTSRELLLALPTATLNLLKQDADTVTLANPQIRVINGEKASVHIGERVPLRVNRRIDTTGVVTNDFQYQDIGVKLEAEPAINLHDEIVLKLTLEVSALGPNLGTIEDPQFRILTRTAKSVLGVRDGEPVILGGLIQDDERTTVRKLPLLGDIPAIGRIFSNESSSDVKTDIIMAITPMVIRGQEIPGTDVTQIWSGKEQDFTLREPFESFAENKGAYLDRPRKGGPNEPGIVSKTARYDQTEKKENRPASSQGDLKDRENEPSNHTDKGTTTLPPDVRPGSLPLAKLPSPGGPVQPAGTLARVTKEQGSPKKAPSKKFIDTGETRRKQASEWPVALPYTVHVNSFVTKEEAETRIRELSAMNYDCFVVPVEVRGKGFFYRVFVGKFANRAAAQALCETLKGKKEFAEDIHVAVRRWALGG